MRLEIAHRNAVTGRLCDIKVIRIIEERAIRTNFPDMVKSRGVLGALHNLYDHTVPENRIQ